MVRVLICSAYGNQKSNLAKAFKYSRYALYKGYATFAPHIEYSSCLSDADDDEREMGINAGLSFLLVCGEMWVFVVDGVLSTGMKKEIKTAIKNDVLIRWFDATDDGDIKELMHIPSDRVPLKRDFVTDLGKATVNKFSEIEALLKKGVKYETLIDDVDDLLGTTMPDRDLEAEQVYENTVKVRDEEG